ncbi:MAG: CYTH domain-containing protein [Lachnospiraceae bacterium]|nr:CYTH domain-containing protein [Lachnospiraceae bacterium]
MEIEKKFLIKGLPAALDSFENKELEQGYLCTSPTVRIRKSDEDYILTYKAKWGTNQIQVEARVNQEIEMPLTFDGYYHLRKKTDGHMITKTRYLIPLPDGHTGELDVFHGALEGLHFIEVEFRDEEDVKAFQPPEWFGEDVSMDIRYTNSFLAKCADLSVFEKKKTDLDEG